MVRPGRRHLSLRLAAPTLACTVAVVALAGCGGSKNGNDTTGQSTTVSAAANTAYERAYSECASTRMVDLAHKYNAKQNKNLIAIAVGRSWAKKAGGGKEAERTGITGCHDGFPFAPK